MKAFLKKIFFVLHIVTIFQSNKVLKKNDEITEQEFWEKNPGLRNKRFQKLTLNLNYNQCWFYLQNGVLRLG
jgi:hypothetical protein